MKSNKVVLILLMVFLFALNVPVYAAAKTELPAKPEIDLVQDPDQPVSSQAPDYKNSIGDIQFYITQNIQDSFAGVHIDRDDNGQEKVILSFVKDLSPSHKGDIRALTDKPELIIFRLVDFTEQQLAEKQKEIDLAWDSLKAEGIQIHHTGVNVFINRIEIGIEPYTKESIAKIHEIFGNEMIEVVEGHEVSLLVQMDGAEPDLALDSDANTEETGIFHNIVAFFKSIFNWLVK